MQQLSEHKIDTAKSYSGFSGHPFLTCGNLLLSDRINIRCLILIKPVSAIVAV